MRLTYTANWRKKQQQHLHKILRIMLLFVVAVSIANMFFSVEVVCIPLSDHGPHIAHGWGQVVRLRHLYAARPGLHLLIGGDGQIHGSADQTLHSKSSISSRALKSWRLWWLSVSHTDDWRFLGRKFHSNEHLNGRSVGDPSGGTRLRCHQRSSNGTLSLHRRQWETVLIGKDSLKKLTTYCWG